MAENINLIPGSSSGPVVEVDIFNYATGLKNPTFQEEIRGGRTAAPITVSSLSFSSKENIRGSLNFTNKTVTSSNYNSKDKIKGTLNFADRIVNSTNFNSKKKNKGKRTGRDGTYSYEDEMFKK